MKAQSTVYIQLQNLYKAKARQDAAEVLDIIQAHPRGKEIDVVEVETFCKNAAFIKLIHGAASNPTDLQKLASTYNLHSILFTLTSSKTRNSRTSNLLSRHPSFQSI